MSGVGPLVSLLTIRGRTTSNGVNGMARRTKFSLGTPFSINFKKDNELTAKATFWVYRNKLIHFCEWLITVLIYIHNYIACQ